MRTVTLHRSMFRAFDPSTGDEFDRVERVLRQLGYSEGLGYSATHMIDGKYVSPPRS